MKSWAAPLDSRIKKKEKSQLTSRLVIKLQSTNGSCVHCQACTLLLRPARVPTSDGQNGLAYAGGPPDEVFSRRGAAGRGLWQWDGAGPPSTFINLDLGAFCCIITVRAVEIRYRPT